MARGICFAGKIKAGILALAVLGAMALSLLLLLVTRMLASPGDKSGE